MPISKPRTGLYLPSFLEPGRTAERGPTTSMSETFSKVEVITGIARRRRFTTEQKLAVVAETMQPGMSISYVARRHGLSPSLVFRWRQLMSEGGKEAVRVDDDVVGASRGAAPRGARP